MPRFSIIRATGVQEALHASIGGTGLQNRKRSRSEPSRAFAALNTNQP